MQVLTVMVSYNTKFLDIITVKKIMKYVPEVNLLIINNNVEENKINYHFFQKNGIKLMENEDTHRLPTLTGKVHGSGIDLAVSYCKQVNIPILMHIEPDCVIKGRKWYDALKKEIEDGFWMAGTQITRSGLIHVSVSAWAVEKISYSFKPVFKGQDIIHPLYDEIYNTREAAKMYVNLNAPEHIYRFLYNWDTGQKNYFQAAINKKSKLIQVDDIIHTWNGSQHAGPKKFLNGFI